MAPLIGVRNLTCSYRVDLPALKRVSFSVGRGERVALVGANGAGKTTLLLCLLGFLPFSGEARVDGAAVVSSNLRRVRSLLGLVFQDPDDQLFMPSVLDDVAFGPLNQGLEREEARGKALETMAGLGIEHLAARHPLQLSMGEKRVAALATVLAMDPAAVLMDEPSANLDPRNRRRLAGLIRRLPSAVLIASHDLDFVSGICDRALLLDAGELVYDGTMGALLGNTELLNRHLL